MQDFLRCRQQGIYTLQGAGMGTEPFKTAREQGLAPLKFEHAVLRTGQLQSMVDWYTAVLQAEVSFGNASIAFLSYDEQNHRIAIRAIPGTGRCQRSAAGRSGTEVT